MPRMETAVTKTPSRWAWMGLAVLTTAVSLAGGCNGTPDAPVPGTVPDPIHLYLPRQVKFHFFTKTNRTFDQSGGIKGMEIYIQALDAYEDPTKAFGSFRFEMYTYVGGRKDNKGEQVATWNVDLSEPKINLTHWDSSARAYKFKLKWERPVPAGQRFVLVAVFDSPYTDRLYAEEEFISGD